MLQWSEYLKSVVESSTKIDGLSLSYDNQRMHISPIVKASILMLEDMISVQGNYNVFVFPEIHQFSKEFLLGKVIYNITSGKIQMSYDPEKFIKGQILKYKNCTVMFDRIEEVYGRLTIFIKFCDGAMYGVPIEIAPYFQVSDSRMLSTSSKFYENYSAREAINAINHPGQSGNVLEALENHKTHLNGSIFYISAIGAAKDFLTSAEFDGRKVTDVLYMAHANGDGEVTNLSPGQLSGNPAIIIAADLYAVHNAIDKGVVPQSIIFAASQSNVIEKQLDAFDNLARRGFPVTCITDTANSFDLSPLIHRGYNLWRWDCDSITDDVVPSEQSFANNRVRNCAKHVVEYLSIGDESISNTVKLLYKQNLDIESQPPKTIIAYEKLFSLAFNMLRSVVPQEQEEKNAYRQVITDCIAGLENEKRFIGSALYSDLSSAAQSLLQVFDTQYKNGKYEAICDIVLSKQYRSICIVIPDKLDRNKYERYWENLNLPCSIKVMYPMEHVENTACNFDIVILVGWLGNKVMQQIIYGYSAKKYLILTYPCEEQWKKSHIRNWKKALNNSGNGEIIRKVFSNNNRQVSYAKFEHIAFDEPAIQADDELDEIEQVIRTSRFKRYSSGTRASEIVEAHPISFVGGYLAFYRIGHKALVATEIIVNNGDKILSKLPEKLEVGDFVIIRESEHDIIRDLADKLLARKGKSGLRSLSSKWKESLFVEALFSTQEEIYQKLCLHGCKKDFVTFRNWMVNDDLIQPNDKEDLQYIASAIGDDVLKEKLDSIYEAGKEVRSAHVQAGRIVSQRLKNKIGEYIQNLGKIDSFNVWDPITLHLEEVGLVKILKVIDVNNAIPVDIGITNRLISE